MSRRWKIPR